jgi:hypothetical protein
MTVQRKSNFQKTKIHEVIIIDLYDRFPMQDLEEN